MKWRTRKVNGALPSVAGNLCSRSTIQTLQRRKRRVLGQLDFADVRLFEVSAGELVRQS